MSPYDNAQGYCNSLRRLHGTHSAIVTGNCSDVSNNTNESELLGSVTNPEPTSSTREIASQSQSPLFALPGELRLMVYRYLSLSPLSAEFPDSRGAYFACRRLQSELRAELRPEKVINEIKGMVSDCANRCSPGDLAFVLPLTRREYIPSFSLLQVVMIYVSADYLTLHLMQEPGECHVLSRLYGYYLKNLHIVVSKRRSINWEFFPWDDMKSMDHKLMAPFVALGRVNCSKITFTLEHMIEGDTDEGKTTTIENIFPGTDVSYQLTIVEDGNGHQLQRSYASSTRFKTLTELEAYSTTTTSHIRVVELGHNKKISCLQFKINSQRTHRVHHVGDCQPWNRPENHLQFTAEGKVQECLYHCPLASPEMI